MLVHKAIDGNTVPAEQVMQKCKVRPSFKILQIKRNDIRVSIVPSKKNENLEISSIFGIGP
jgi:hypothetical protein